MAADYHFEYDAASSVLAVRVTGRFTNGVFKQFFADTARYLAEREVRGAVLDLSTAQAFDLSADVVRQMGHVQPLLPGPVPRYVVATTDHAFGMARMFQTIAEGPRALHIVRSLAKAYAELGITTPQFERLPDLI